MPALESAPRRDIRGELDRLLRWRPTTSKALIAPAGKEIAIGVQLVEQTLVVAPVDELVSLPWGDAAPIERHRLVFFDTETTGLAGGVGTKAFMIGAARIENERLCLRQWYLTKLAGEQAMLRAFSDSLPEQPVFVSYNGLSYDAPLLKGRYRIHRQQHPFESMRHVDLLYATRRRYRGRWENCRLQTIERHALGILREDDLPGSEAPKAWLDFLRGRSSTNLGRVVGHNRQDLLSLCSLLNHLCDLRDNSDGRL